MAAERKRFGIVIPAWKGAMFVYRIKEYPNRVEVVQVCPTKELAIQTAEKLIQGTDAKYEIVDLSTQDFIKRIDPPLVPCPLARGKTASLLLLLQLLSVHHNAEVLRQDCDGDGVLTSMDFENSD